MVKIRRLESIVAVYISEFILTHFSSVTFLYPLKTTENQIFSDVFRGYRNVTLD